LPASRAKRARSSGRARVLHVTSAKGGAGATTVAVNTAIALQESQGGVLLVDFAPLGPCCSSLNVRANVWHRRRIAELASHGFFSARWVDDPVQRGLATLGWSATTPLTNTTAAEKARLFDLLVANFRYVVVGRLQQTRPDLAHSFVTCPNAVLLVAQTDVISLWSAGRFVLFWKKGQFVIVSAWCS